jgi:C-terminal processing protease CtpA/Prc
MSSRSQSLRRRSIRRCSAPFIAALYVLLVQCGPSSWPGGVHAVFGWSSEAVRVADVPADGPAAKAGLLPGDRLIAIDGAPVAGLSSAEVQKKLAGEVGTIAVLTIERDGKPVEIRVERAPYRRPQISGLSAPPT